MQYVDSDHPDIVAFAQRITAGASSPAEKASRLFEAVRDLVRYHPYGFSLDADAFRASAVLHTERSWCVPKAVLLCAVVRAVGIPAKLGFADVQNHFQSEKLMARMGTDIFMWHGYVAMEIDGRWLKATPAFNKALCERMGVEPLAFDGQHDALFQQFTGDGRRYMEYLVDRGTYDDLPLDAIMASFAEHYPGLASWQPGEKDAMFSAG